MSRKIIYALLALTMIFTAGSTTTCSESGIGGLWPVVGNELVTTLSVDPETFCVNDIVTFTANVVDEDPDNPFVAARYQWAANGELYTSTTTNQKQMMFTEAGTYFVEVTISGTRGGIPLVEIAGMYVTVEDFPEGTDDPSALTVTISGPDEVMVGHSGSYSATVSSGSATFTWDLLGDSATLGSTSGSSTTVTGVDIGYVTLVVEARDSELGNVLATSSLSIDIVPDYVVWYTGNVDCWGSPRVYVTTRTSFDSWQSTASIPGGGTDTTEELIKVEMQGGFEDQASAMTWICGQFTSRRSSYWCGAHYNVGDTSYTVGNIDCNFDDLPWVEN